MELQNEERLSPFSFSKSEDKGVLQFACLIVFFIYIEKKRFKLIINFHLFGNCAILLFPLTRPVRLSVGLLVGWSVGRS